MTENRWEITCCVVVEACGGKSYLLGMRVGICHGINPTLPPRYRHIHPVMISRIMVSKLLFVTRKHFFTDRTSFLPLVPPARLTFCEMFDSDKAADKNRTFQGAEPELGAGGREKSLSTTMSD
jgi:hypothetical protein